MQKVYFLNIKIKYKNNLFQMHVLTKFKTQ